MPANRRLVWPAVCAAIAALTFVLQHLGTFDRLDNGVAEWRARLLAHEVESDIVIVGIDALSLATLNEWPWPRRHHARLLQQLSRSEPTAVFIDIDFSSVASAEDDALLERELSRWSGSPVLLASHIQNTAGDIGEPILAVPLERFAQHSEAASVNLRPDRDGLVRRLRSSWTFDGQELPSAFAHGRDIGTGIDVPLDFSILPSSFRYTSFVDVLGARIDPAVFDGKRVFVGAVAAELRDTVAVPVYQALPGVVVQALAAESVRAGVITRPGAGLVAALIALVVVAAAAGFAGRGWRVNLAVLSIALPGIAGLSFALYAGARIDLPVVPFAVTVSLVFVAATLRSLDHETWRALAYAIGLARKDALLQSVVDSSIDSIIGIDGGGRIRMANSSAEKLFGRPAGACIGERIEALIPALHKMQNVLDGAGRRLECRGCRTDGSTFPVEVAISPVNADSDPQFTAIVRDISERKQHEAKLRHQATHDALTGLPNRAALMTRLDGLLAPAARRGGVCVLTLGLARFGDVNHTLGHDVGDEVLIEIAARFRAAVEPGVPVCRLGGDEFVVVLDALGDRTLIDVIAQSLVDSLKTPVTVRDLAIEVGVSIGAAIAPENARTARELLQRADVAMRAAKRRGAPVEYYDAAYDQNTVRRLRMVGQLRKAIESDELAMHYQPQIELATGRVRGVEALLRWEHAGDGAVSPGEFIPLAEATDLIWPLTDWSLNRALRDLVQLSVDDADLRVAVNISARVVQDAGLPQRVDALLTRHRIGPERIEIEITESAMMIDPERALHVVTALKRLGVTISIDDYGTGFSSLGYLRDLHADVLKLDKSFVLDIDRRPRDRVIAESTARMAGALGLDIVAEGIETASAAEFLKAAGYHLGQGYYFSRPLAIGPCRQFIAHRNGGTRRAAG